MSRDEQKSRMAQEQKHVIDLVKYLLEEVKADCTLPDHCGASAYLVAVTAYVKQRNAYSPKVTECEALPIYNNIYEQLVEVMSPYWLKETTIRHGRSSELHNVIRRSYAFVDEYLLRIVQAKRHRLRNRPHDPKNPKEVERINGLSNYFKIITRIKFWNTCSVIIIMFWFLNNYFVYLSQSMNFLVGRFG